MSRTAPRPNTRSRPIVSSTNTYSHHANLEAPLADVGKMARLQPQTADHWGGSNSELDRILEGPSTTVAPSYLDFNMQMLSEEPFSMGDYLGGGTPTFDGYPSTKQQSVFDPALWDNSIAPPPPSTATFSNYHNSMQSHTNLDYFSLNTELEQLVDPSSLHTEEVSVAAAAIEKKAPPSSIPDQTQDDSGTGTPVKIPKKRGRKRKQLDADAQVVERKKFLERNRVAANRCRERKKTYVSNLEGRSKDLQSRNAYLRAEMERLGEEVVALRVLVGVECGCDDAVLAANLRERLGADGALDAEGVEEVVQRFLRLRTEGVVPAGTWEGMGMDQLAMSSAGGSSRSESVMDEVFSPEEEKMEDGPDSSESSPIEISEAEKLNYLAL